MGKNGSIEFTIIIPVIYERFPHNRILLGGGGERLCVAG